jgi:thymidylate kinase
MLSTGGAIIAFTGPEATGKSTLVNECKSWLGEAFAVKVVHAGKPPSTWLTKPFNLVLPLLRRKMPTMRTNSLEGHISSSVGASQAPPKKGISALIYAIRSVLIAWDRCQLLVGVRQAAANGQIVICDRYPSEEVGAMDSPRLQAGSASAGLGSVIYNWLARQEARLYKQVGPPDVVLKLRVSIETAKQRNHERIKDSKESAAYVESRHRQSRNWHRSGTKYQFDIDTEQSLPDTINNVKRAIWESI